MTQPFRFINGQLAINAKDLIEICEQYPTDAIYHLNREDFENWLDYIGENILAQLAKEARLSSVNGDRALQQFLATCKSPGNDTALADIDAIEAENEPVNKVEILDSFATPEEKKEFITLPLSELENLPSSPTLSTATRLELTEEEISASSPENSNSLPLYKAALIDRKTDKRFEFSPAKNTIYIGRVNEELPVQVDISELENADIISRVHAAIKLENEKFFLEDAGSSNGTWLNGEKLKPGIRFRKEINSGDEIAFGKKQSIKLIFESNIN